VKIAIYAGRCLPIHAATLAERPLAGTETAVIRIADRLARRDHEVTVFTSHGAPPPSTPRYLPASAVKSKEYVDCFIAVKEWLPALLRVPCRKQCFWTGDSHEASPNFGLGDRRVARLLDHFLAVSRWQADTLCRESGFPRERAHVIGNGVHLADFHGSEPRRRKRLVYTSAPTRGLDLVPSLYLELKRLHPDLELHVFSGFEVYDTDRPYAAPLRARYEATLAEVGGLPDCHLHGNILQKDLARELMRSAILFYPCTFLETSCIAAMEAMAAGCVVVTSDAGALPETVGDAGVLVPGVPGTEDYRRAFVSATHRLLSDDALWEDLSARARQRALGQMGWEACADRLERVLTDG
jgi:glycosyltransferase involved in cell wall biosynthesis